MLLKLFQGKEAYTYKKKNYEKLFLTTLKLNLHTSYACLS